VTQYRCYWGAERSSCRPTKTITIRQYDQDHSLQPGGPLSNQLHHAGDSLHLRLGGQTVNLTGFAPRSWAWASEQAPGGAAVTLTIQTSGVYTLNLLMREDGLLIDRLLLTTDSLA
jgi:hypothetical protein